MVVDDQQSMRGLARQCLKRMGIVNVALAASGDAALKDLQGAKFDVVISDLNMPGMSGMDLAKEVTVSDAYTWTESTWDLEKGHTEGVDSRFHVVAYDYGVKRNILRMLVERGCKLTVVPAQTAPTPTP